MKVLFLLIFNVLFFLSNSMGQAPGIEWQHCYGGTDYDDGVSLIKCENSYILLGRVESIDGNVIGNHGADDYWAVKLDSSGNIIWQKALGGSAVDFPSSAIKIGNNKFIFAGFSHSSDGDVSTNHGNGDVWIACLDSSATLIWQKSYGGSDFEGGTYVVENDSGSFIFCTTTYSNDGDISFNHGASDIWVVNTDSIGNIDWQVTIGGTLDDYAKAFLKTKNNEYFIVGEVYSTDGDITTTPRGGQDYWLCRLDSLGNIKWQKNYGGSSDDEAKDAIETSDGGFLIVGRSSSVDGDVTGNHGYNDFWLIKTDSIGNLIWQKSFGGSRLDDAWTLDTTNDNGILISGISSSYDGDISSAVDTFSLDIWIVKLDSNGNIEWDKSIGGSGVDMGESITSTSDGGCILLGYSSSYDGDVSGHHGATDLWTVKLSPLTDAITVFENSLKDLTAFITFSDLHINFHTTSSQMLQIQLFDITGRLLFEKTIEPVVGRNELVLPIGDLKAGVYFVRMGSEVCKVIAH